jgi:tetratricopeptide (TPR) repeat protein
MTESIGAVKDAVAARAPVLAAETRNGVAVLASAGSTALARSGATAADAATGGAHGQAPEPIRSSLPVDPEVAALVVERKAQLAMLSNEGPRLLEAGNFARAADICGAWASLDLDNGKAWACYGRALQAQGRHYQAVKALRKARQYDPADGTLDAAINRSQRGIVADFLARRSL